jgi:hypothetical protein
MENYIKNFELFNEIIVYDFNIYNGGIGDCIKFYMYILNLCIKDNKRLYYKKNNILIENYIKLKYDILYIHDEKILNNYTIVKPNMFYDKINNNYCENNYGYFINIGDVFYFSDEIINNSLLIFPKSISNYISIHLRLGDKFLEIKDKRLKNIIDKKNDIRYFSLEQIDKIVEENIDENIFFCCDNYSFRQKTKDKYNNIIITNGEIGHTSYLITSPKQILDSLTELYLLTKSKKIYAASSSGFSIVAANFNNIPYIKLY